MEYDVSCINKLCLLHLPIQLQPYPYARSPQLVDSDMKTKTKSFFIAVIEILALSINDNSIIAAAATTLPSPCIYSIIIEPSMQASSSI